MRNFKKEIYKESILDNIQILDPFDYIIVTFQYTPPTGSDYDLDTLTTFRYPNSVLSGTQSNNTVGFIPGTGVIGCGAGSAVPTTGNINTSYLYFGGDDVGQSQQGTFGESVLISFKNLETSGITTSSDIIVDMYAGWHSGTSSYAINIKYETFIGGTISKEIVNGVTTNRFISTGVSVLPPQISPYTNIVTGNCGTGVDIKRKVASISFNLITKVSNITFF